MTVRRSNACEGSACVEIAVDLIAHQLASLAPTVRAAVCVAAMRRAKEIAAPAAEKGPVDDDT